MTSLIKFTFGKQPPAYGTRKIKRKFLRYPRFFCLPGTNTLQVRWLGIEKVVYECQTWTGIVFATENKADYAGWRAIEWADA